LELLAKGQAAQKELFLDRFNRPKTAIFETSFGLEGKQAQKSHL
jgi:hypothetical protein